MALFRATNILKTEEHNGFPIMNINFNDKSTTGNFISTYYHKQCELIVKLAFILELNFPK